MCEKHTVTEDNYVSLGLKQDKAISALEFGFSCNNAGTGQKVLGAALMWKVLRRCAPSRLGDMPDEMPAPGEAYAWAGTVGGIMAVLAAVGTAFLTVLPLLLSLTTSSPRVFGVREIPPHWTVDLSREFHYISMSTR